MFDIKQLHLKSRVIPLTIMLIWIAPQIHADASSNSSIDCSTANVNFIENPEWTYQERLEAMNKAFYESVQRYELCQLSNQSSSSTASANAGAQTAGSENNQTQTNSIASPLVKGTETTTKAETVANDSTLTDKSDKQSVALKEIFSPNGRTPKDIPSADNDDAMAAQIRLAAEIENNPNKKAQLWNEYRKYKGLPIQ